jgi:hypothetical protein
MMTQTLPLTMILGAAHTGETIGYRVLNLDRSQYSAFATTGVTESDVSGTYYVSGGVVVPDAGGYIVVGLVATDYGETNVAASPLAEVGEGTLTMREMLRVMLAGLAGKSAGGGTATITFRDVGDAKNRISATVDANGNRTAITLDAT